MNVPSMPIDGRLRRHFRKMGANGILGHIAQRKTYMIAKIKIPEIGSFIGASISVVYKSANSKSGACQVALSFMTSWIIFRPLAILRLFFN